MLPHSVNSVFCHLAMKGQCGKSIIGKYSVGRIIGGNEIKGNS